jgi:hypothetical protein
MKKTYRVLNEENDDKLENCAFSLILDSNEVYKTGVNSPYVSIVLKEIRTLHKMGIREIDVSLKNVVYIGRDHTGKVKTIIWK